VLRRKTRDELHAAHVADLKESHARLVEALADQIDYLRVLLGRPNLLRMTPANPSEQPAYDPLGFEAPYLGEEEEDLLALHQFGRVDDHTLARLQGDLGLPSLEADEFGE